MPNLGTINRVSVYMYEFDMNVNMLRSNKKYRHLLQ